MPDAPISDGSIIEVAVEDRIARVLLNRPEALNTVNWDLIRRMDAAMEELSRDDGVWAAYLEGAGNRTFCAGADLKERKTMPPAEVPAFVDLISGTMTRIAEAVVPFVAAVGGFAFGGGMEAALGCDLRVVGPNAKLGLTETRLGIIPGAGGTQRLSRLVGTGRARSLILTGRRIGADEALQMGVAEHRADDALEGALAIAGEIAKCGPQAVRAAKQAIDGGFDLPMTEALAHERACYDTTLESEDRFEALRAFAEKRPPVFTGR